MHSLSAQAGLLNIAGIVTYFIGTAHVSPAVAFVALPSPRRTARRLLIRCESVDRARLARRRVRRPLALSAAHRATDYGGRMQTPESAARDQILTVMRRAPNVM